MKKIDWKKLKLGLHEFAIGFTFAMGGIIGLKSWIASIFVCLFGYLLLDQYVNLIKNSDENE